MWSTFVVEQVAFKIMTRTGEGSVGGIIMNPLLKEGRTDRVHELGLSPRKGMGRPLAFLFSFSMKEKIDGEERCCIKIQIEGGIGSFR